MNVNSETNPLVIDTYANNIDTTHYASVDTTGLEPTGTKTISTFADNIDVKSYEFVDTSGLEPTGTKTITEFSDSIDVKSYEFADTTSLEPTGTYTVTETLYDVDISQYEKIEIPYMAETLVFDANGGEWSNTGGTTLTKNYVEETGVHAVNDPDFHESGYTFVGWYTT